jgi:predicted acetyltransferase
MADDAVMSVELAEARQSEARLIERMLDDYLQELDRHRDVCVGATDSASYPYLDAYWSEPGRHAFLIRSDGRVVGFAFIRDPASTGSAGHQLAEFYIEPDSRRLGIGRRAAAAIWRRFPGQWELQVHARNSAAVQFWAACAEAETGEAPQLREVQAPDGRRVQFGFRIGHTAVTSPARCAYIAAFAALVASAGDLLLLYVANSQRDALGLPRAGPAWLWLGGVLGVVAIPFYAFGYWSASRLVAAASNRAARTLFICGTAGALVGSVIHGVTTVHIAAELEAAGPGRDPLASLLGWGPPILVLWGVAALLVIAASALFLWFVGRGATAVPRAVALANPAFGTIALAAAGLPSVVLRSFLTPAAPNIAHFIFFVVCWRVARPSGSRAGKRAA